MPEPKTNLDQLMRDPKAAKLLKQKDLLKNLMQLLNQSAGDSLKGAAASAAKGDPSALTGLLRQVMQSKEGAQLVQRINQAVPEDKR